MPSLMLWGTFMSFSFFMHFGGGFFHQHFSCQAIFKTISISFQNDSLKLVLQTQYKVCNLLLTLDLRLVIESH